MVNKFKLNGKLGDCFGYDFLKLLNGPPVHMEKVSPISKIPTHYCDLIFQSNKRITHVLNKPSQLIATTKMTI